MVGVWSRPCFFSGKEMKKNEPIDDLVVVELHHFVEISMGLEFVVFYWVDGGEIGEGCEELVA